MINIVTQHFYLNRILLLAVGLWPYHKSRLVRLQLVVLYGILISCILFQLSTFLTSKCTVELVIKIFFSTSVFVSFVLNYNTFYINSKAVKDLLEQLQRIYDKLKDDNEIAILEKYGNNARHYTAMLLLLATCFWSILISIQVWSRINNNIVSINKSKSHQLLLFECEYFVDQEKYYYLILLHINVAILIGGIAILATGTTVIAYFQHACGLFRIASHRIQHAIEINILKNIENKNEDMIYERIICAVDMHRQAIRFSKKILSSFAISYFCLTIVLVISVSLGLFRIISHGYDAQEFIVTLINLIIHYIYMFLANNMSQKIMDHNNDIFATAYNVKWYVAHLNIQKAILFVLQRGTQPYILKIGEILVTSLEGFATLTKTSMSYFTVLYSTRQ